MILLPNLELDKDWNKWLCNWSLEEVAPQLSECTTGQEDTTQPSPVKLHPFPS